MPRHYRKMVPAVLSWETADGSLLVCLSEVSTVTVSLTARGLRERFGSLPTSKIFLSLSIISNAR